MERPWNARRGALLGMVMCLAASALVASPTLSTRLDPSQGSPAGGSGDSYAPILSPDGRYVLFASTANNLVLTTNNNPIPVLLPPKLNVFLRDRTNGTTTLVSVNLSGTAGGNDDSIPSAISANGRYALFESSASDLVPGDTNNATDVFVRDLLKGTTLLVSVSTNGSVGDGASRSSVMTPDGRYVAFVSAADNLVRDDTNSIPDVFLRDLRTRVTLLASVGAMSTNRTTPTGSSEAPDITPDGTCVAFYSTATNLVPGVTSAGDIYVHDFIDDVTFWASSAARPALQSLGRSANAVCYNHALSADGEFVAYEASPVSGLSGSSAGLILRYDLWSGFTDLAHTNAAVATAAYEDIRSLDMTPDGRFIAFIANTNGSSGGTTCVCLWDAQAGAATLVSGNLSNAVPASSTCDWPTLDSSGRFVAFLSSSTNMVTNAVIGDYHLYLRDTQTASTLLLDADTNGVGAGVSPATGPRLSADGRFAAFENLDARLVPNDRNHDYDVFVRDTVARATELVSVHDPTLPSLSPNGPSLLSSLSVSTNCQYLAFASEADNLAPNDTNGCRDVFVRDLQLGTNFLVSVSTNGATSGDGPSTDSAISADGRYVAFSSLADDLVAGDNNKAQDVFVRNLQAGTTVLISVNTTGSGPGNGDSYSPVLSADGRWVLFRSKATNLKTGSFSGTDNFFVRNLQSGTTYALTTTGAGTAAMTPDGRYIAFSGSSIYVYVWDTQSAANVYTITAGGTSATVGISPDGNRIAYGLSSQLHVADRAANTNGVIGATASSSHLGLRFSGDGRWLAYAAPLNSTNQVYLYDFQARASILLSQSYSSGGAANGVSDSPDISPDGRFVAYRSSATDIVPADSNGVPDIFLYDRLNGTTTLLSLSRFGDKTADNRSLTPVFSADGQTLLFQTWACDIVEQDFNHSSDILAYSLYVSGQIPLFSATVLRGNGAGQPPWITWPVVAGKVYRVQFKNALEDPLWQEFSGGVILVGDQGYFNDLSAGPGPRFYRIVAY